MKNNKVGQRIISVLLVLSLMCVTSVASLAAEAEASQRPEDIAASRIASGTIVYDGAGKIEGGDMWKWSDGFNVPESGMYRITYTVMTEPSNNLISLYVGNNIDLGRVDVQRYGSMHGYFDKYLNAGRGIAEVHLSMPKACGISIIVSKV